MDKFDWEKDLRKRLTNIVKSDCQTKCATRQFDVAIEWAKWAIKWPNHCTECHGTGRYKGITNSPTKIFGTCVQCNWKGFCPQCGEAAWDVEKNKLCTVCPFCDYNHVASRPPLFPSDYECGCGEYFGGKEKDDG